MSGARGWRRGWLRHRRHRYPLEVPNLEAKIMDFLIGINDYKCINHYKCWIFYFQRLVLTKVWILDFRGLQPINSRELWSGHRFPHHGSYHVIIFGYLVAVIIFGSHRSPGGSWPAHGWCCFEERAKRAAGTFPTWNRRWVATKNELYQSEHWWRGWYQLESIICGVDLGKFISPTWNVPTAIQNWSRSLCVFNLPMVVYVMYESHRKGWVEKSRLLWTFVQRINTLCDAWCIGLTHKTEDLLTRQIWGKQKKHKLVLVTWEAKRKRRKLVQKRTLVRTEAEDNRIILRRLNISSSLTRILRFKTSIRYL